MKTKSPKKKTREQAGQMASLRSGTLVGRPKRKTAEQRRAGQFLELYGIVHFLLTEQRCPVIFDGKLAYVRCPGVSKEAFKQAIDHRVINNLVDYCKRHVPNGKVITHAGPPND